jgi:hypothetical protein
MSPDAVSCIVTIALSVSWQSLSEIPEFKSISLGSYGQRVDSPSLDESGTWKNVGRTTLALVRVFFSVLFPMVNSYRSPLGRDMHLG